MKFNCLLILMLLLNSVSPLYGKGFDLIGWNGEQEFILEGEWSFKNRQLFDPSRITEKEIETWASWPIPHASYDDSNKFNFASFATTLTGLEPGGIVTFAFPRIGSFIAASCFTLPTKFSPLQCIGRRCNFFRSMILIIGFIVELLITN